VIFDVGGCRRSGSGRELAVAAQHRASASWLKSGATVGIIVGAFQT
jgi:hypothetical protein